MVARIFKSTFGKMAGGALAAASVALPMTAAPIAAPAVAQSAQTDFATFNDANRSADFVRTRAAMNSENRIAIIVWGGNRELQQQAYNAALDLRDAGIPLAFIVGPDLNNFDVDANFQVYARGVPVYEHNGAHIGGQNVHLVRGEVVRMGRAAHGRHFPVEVANATLSR